MQSLCKSGVSLKQPNDHLITVKKKIFISDILAFSALLLLMPLCYLPSLHSSSSFLPLADGTEGQLSAEEEEARRIAEMGKPILGEHSRLEVVIEESYEFKVHYSIYFSYKVFSKTTALCSCPVDCSGQPLSRVITQDHSLPV